MKTKDQNISIIFLILSSVVFLASCKKENSADTSAVSPTTISNLQAIAVAAGTTSNDSIYVIGTCANSHHLDSVSFTNLPATVTDYLTTNYDGYTFQRAFTDKDSSGNIAGYAVIIQYNGNPVGLKFDASGNFIRVLEQREGRDLSGEGGTKVDVLMTGMEDTEIQLHLLHFQQLYYLTLPQIIPAIL